MNPQGIVASLKFSGVVRGPDGQIQDIVTSHQVPELYAKALGKLQEKGEACPEHVMEKIYDRLGPRACEIHR